MQSPNSERLTKRLLVTGCGRSGTKFTALLLRRLGLDVGHERMGSDGIAAWTMAVEAPTTPWGPGSGGFVFENVFHQVRHPLAVVSSCATFKSDSWDYIYAHTSAAASDPLIHRAAAYWLEWNEHAERISNWRYRIEAIDDVFDDLCNRLDLPADRDALDKVARNTNTRRHGRLFHYYDAGLARLGLPRRGEAEPAAADVRWEDITALDADLSARLRRKAAAYGYEA